MPEFNKTFDDFFFLRLDAFSMFQSVLKTF